MASIYDELTAKWSTLSGDTDAKLVAINALTVAGPNADVKLSDVVGYFATIGKLGTLETYANSTPTDENKAAVSAARTFFILINAPRMTVIETSNPQVYAATQQALEVIAADPASGLVQADVDNLFSLAATTTPWWRSVGFTQAIGTADLTLAGGLI